MQAMVMRGNGFGQSRFYVSRNPATDVLGDGNSINVKITPDGRFGVFESVATNLVDDDHNSVSDIFRFEIRNDALYALERISKTSYNGESNGASKNATISSDGQCVAFESEASNLVALDQNNRSDIMLKWMVTGEIVRLARTTDGNQPNGASSTPVISGDCGSIVYASRADNLAPGDNNSAADAYLVSMRSGPPALVAGPLDEPGATRVPLPSPDPPNPSCPAGFFVATVSDGPGTGVTPGAFGMELLLDEPGTRVLAGGLNFGGLLDAGQVGFAGFNFANSGNEDQRLNLSLTGSPASASSGTLAVRVKIVRQTSEAVTTVFEAPALLSFAQPTTASLVVQPGFYVATVATEGAPADAAGGEPEGQFFFSLTTSFVDRPGGGFQGGAVVGGYHATHPFGGVSGFAGFCLATPHSSSVRVLARPSYGATGAQDLRLRVQDTQQRDVIVVPAG